MTGAAPEAGVSEEAVRCSAWARHVELEPIGSAGSYRGFVLAEVPLPWPRDIGQVPALEALGAWSAAAGYRLQALVPRPDRPRRLIVHAAAGGDGWFAGYRRAVAAADGVSGAGLADMAEAAVADRFGGADPAWGTDVLVCTHGRRDVCCGSLGTELALGLLAGGGFDGGGDTAQAGGIGRAGGIDQGGGIDRAGGGPGGAGPVARPVDLHRTSHTGGHRFAPTFVILPEGTAWAFADADLVRAVVARTADLVGAARHYRGCTGLAGPRVQALEREVLVRTGWSLLDRARRGVASSDSPLVRLEVRGDDGRVDAWEAEVGPGRTLPVPDCTRPLSAATKTETEWVVTGLRRA